jgi:hypothetical protein
MTLSRRAMVRGVAASSALGLGGCDYIIGRDAGTYRARLSIAVETPQGLRQAFGVIEIAYKMVGNFNGGGLMSRETLRGEAVFLDLGQGRHVIMLLAHGPHGEGFDTYLPTRLFLRLAGYDAVDALLKGRTLAGAAELQGADIPTLVTFTNLADPATARVVPPTEAGFTAAFGPGHRLSRVTLEMVPAGVWPFNLVGLSGVPMTRGIENRMPGLKNPEQWNAPLRALPFDPNRFLAGSGAFKRNM